MERQRREKSPAALGLTAAEVALLMGLSATSLWELRRARLDFPRPLRLWPGGRGLYDRESVLRWWRREARKAQQGGA